MKIIVKFLPCLFVYLTLLSCEQQKPVSENIHELAVDHVNDLRVSVYFTAHSVERLLNGPQGRREAVSLMQANGITKVYLEVYRSGLIVSPQLLAEVKDYFMRNSFEVVGGIATVPGGDFGVKQEGKLGWFNWQNEKTQKDLRQVMLDVAPIFDTFIVDDFLCTGDTSLESQAAKGDREWSVYRRELMTELATSIFIDPAKSVNPDIHMIIKYPQWYDRFHLFGYDVESGPKLFDEVWVGTETRGQYTQRFGFVQPYEGFVNYRWISSLSGDKTGGAWFDHGDCDALDFIEQAYQSVLAGADELVIFNYGSFVQGHPGHHQLRMDLEKLYDLARTVKSSPVIGIPAYKPPHSDAGGDLYIMDFMGMLGVPIIPVSQYPQSAATIFLPTQAAEDTDIIQKVEESLKNGARVIATSGFLAKVKDDGRLAAIAGITKPIRQSVLAEQLMVEGSKLALSQPLEHEAMFDVLEAESVLISDLKKATIPYLTKNKSGNFYVLNSHTFSEADFEAVGEVLLCPRPLGILELPTSWVNKIRQAFNSKLAYHLSGPSRVTMQPLSNGEIVLHNYNRVPVEIRVSGFEYDRAVDGFTGEELQTVDHAIQIKMHQRSRIWIRQDQIVIQ